MPPRPTHRLDIHLVPHDRTDAALRHVDALWDSWVSEGFLAGAGRSSEPGARAHALVAGGFVRARKDDPGEVVLYANQVGGFQVRCPACGTGLAREFRKQGDTVCPSCGGAFPIDALDCRPPVALGRASLVLCDVADAEVTAIPAGWHVILRRVR